MNKRFLAVALSMLLVFGAGCTGNALSGNKDDNQSNAQIVQSNPQPDAPDTIETIQNPDEGESGSSENTEDEKTQLPPMETEFHAEYDGWIYYRQYNTEDLSNPISLISELCTVTTIRVKHVPFTEWTRTETPKCISKKIPDSAESVSPTPSCFHRNS